MTQEHNQLSNNETDAILNSNPNKKLIEQTLPDPNKELTTTRYNYISVGGVPPEAIVNQSNDVTEAITVVEQDKVVLVSAVSAKQKSREKGRAFYGEDAVGVRKIEQDGQEHYLLTATDGMGGSEIAYVLAQALCRQAALSGSLDFANNITKAVALAESLKGKFKYWEYDEKTLPKVQIQQMTEQVFDEETGLGIGTTYNQISVNTNTGEVRGTFFSDGWVGIIKNNQLTELDCDIDSLFGGIGPSRFVGTHMSSVNRPVSLADLVAKLTPEQQKQITTSDNEVILASGDKVIIMSDNIDRIKHAGGFDALIEAISKDDVEAIKELFEVHGGDDSSIVFYTQH